MKEITFKEIKAGDYIYFKRKPNDEGHVLEMYGRLCYYDDDKFVLKEFFKVDDWDILFNDSNNIRFSKDNHMKISKDVDNFYIMYKMTKEEMQKKIMATRIQYGN